MLNRYEEMFNQKVERFACHKNYKLLKKSADWAISWSGGFGLKSITAEDFMDRIIAMPDDYIQDWLDGNNTLEWREEDKTMREAIKGGWTELLRKYPNAIIHKIRENMTQFYRAYGYDILSTPQGTFALKQKESEENSLCEK